MMAFLRGLFGLPREPTEDVDLWTFTITTPGWDPPPEPDRPGWPSLLARPEPSIGAWWTPAHDGLLRTMIKERRWWWNLTATDQIAAVDPFTFASWKAEHEDHNNVWYNRVMYFAQDRAVRLGAVLGKLAKVGILLNDL